MLSQLVKSQGKGQGGTKSFVPLKTVPDKASQPAQRTHLENLWSVNVATTRYQPKLVKLVDEGSVILSLVLTQVFKPSVVIAQHISRNVTLSGRFTSGSSGPSSSSSHSLPLAGPSSSSSHSLPLAGPSSSSSHSLPLAGPSSSSSHSLPLAGPSSSSSHSLPLAGPSSSSSHSYPVVDTSSTPHTLPAARPSFSGPHTPLVAGPTSSLSFVPTSSVARMHPPVADPSSSSSLVAPTVTSLFRASTLATTTGLQVYFVHKGVCLMY